MARTVRDANLETRAARMRLKPRHEPYWRAIEPGRHLGYRKGPLGGIWKARVLLDDGNYAKATLCRADDVLDSDGAAVLSYREAQGKARAWFAQQARVAAGLEPVPARPYTVADAMRDYLAWFERHRRGLVFTRGAIAAHILPALGEVQVVRLTSASIRAWHEGMANAPARLRSRVGGTLNFRPAKVADAKRRRKATANRVLTILKAALNHTWREGKSASDEAWRKVRPYRDVDAPVVRYLTESECVRVINACPPDFRRLVQGALLTGCRYGELTALKVSDFNPDSGTVAILSSKSGKRRHVVLTDEGQRFMAELAAGRKSEQLLFTKADGGPWKAAHQRRPLIDACRHAKIEPSVSFHVLRHTHGSILAMKGVPLAVIGQQLGHADTRMTQRHYAHLAPSYVADTIRAAFPNFGIASEGKVTVLAPKAAR